MRRIPIILVTVALIGAACGDDDAGGTISTTTQPMTTTTVTATTTTLPPLPDALNEQWDVTWREWLPADGATARYQAETLDGEPIEIEARMERGVEWHGEIWDRVSFGTVAIDQDGVAVYLDTSEPWVLRIGGFTITGELMPGEVEQEVLIEAPAIDVLALLDGTQRWEGELAITLGQDENPMTWMMTVDATVEPGPTLETPAGTFDSLLVRVDLGGQYIGGDDLTRTLPIDVWIDPTEGLLGVGESFVFLDMLLAEPWG